MNDIFETQKQQVNKVPKKRNESEFTKFKKQLYQQYFINMRQFGKEDKIVPYIEWLKDVNNAKIK